MALKSVYEKAEDVPEALKDEYKEVDGKWVIDVENVDALPRVATLKNENAQRRISEKKAKDALSAFGDLKPEEVRSQLERIPELELAAEGKIDDKKIEKIVETRLNSKVAPIQRELDQTKQKLGESEKVITEYRVKEKTRTIHDSVRQAASKAKLRPEALEDALMLGERVLDVDDTGNVVTKDGVGVTPGVDPSVWFTELQSKRPHWWGETVGGGAGGNQGGTSAGKNPFTHEDWDMTEQGRIHRENPTRAAQLAKAAGTVVGGGKPPPKRK
jgi:hypothetical protein